AGIDRHGDGARLEGGEQSFQQLRTIVLQYRHAIALANPGLAKLIRELVGARIELAIAPALITKDDRGMVRGLLRGLCHHRPDIHLELRYRTMSCSRSAPPMPRNWWLMPGSACRSPGLPEKTIAPLLMIRMRSATPSAKARFCSTSRMDAPWAFSFLINAPTS